jgi:hypothetical protein
MTITVQQIADQINRLKPGQQIDFSLRTLEDIKICYLEYRTPMELILEKVYGSAVGVVEWWKDTEKQHVTFRKTFIDEPCPQCGSADIKTGKGNMFCNACGFFPIYYKEKLNGFPAIEGSIREPERPLTGNIPRSCDDQRTDGRIINENDRSGNVVVTRKGTWTW